MLQGPEKTIKRARKLRREMSLPEVLLWRELRKRPAGLKFRHQHPAGPYVADFFCHEARLVVEVDGEAHGRGDRPERDAARDAWFAERRFEIMRVPAREVLGDFDGVVRGISARAEALTPLHQPSPSATAGPPPPLGEEFL
jgi:very-short-patch-repair endonuclease